MTRRGVLVAGIGGGSLGTEILKCLHAAGRRPVYGCDVSPLAFGHYAGLAEQTFLVDRGRYVDQILEFCLAHGAAAVIPGGEEPLQLLGAAAGPMREAGVELIANALGVIEIAGDKRITLARLQELGFPVPRWAAAEGGEVPAGFTYPCVVKPAVASGGSASTFLAASEAEARAWVAHLGRIGLAAVLQEYVPLDEGEFTIGVLSLRDGTVAGTVAMERRFPSKLSVHSTSPSGLISSGLSQGFIGEFPDLSRQAEAIARAVGSCGPINIQGRVRDGTLLTFELNARFSASTYLRALAGFNEVETYLAHVLEGEVPQPPQLRTGYYLRGLAETFVGEAQLVR